MHVIFRETPGMEDMASPRDLRQTPADIVILSFSDSDLSAFAAGWRTSAGLPSLRIANLATLAHPLSVDTYVEQTLAGAKAILIRLIGGASYWSYGLQQVEALARARGIKLAVLPGDGRVDARLDAASTLPVAQLRRLARLCDDGGADAARAVLLELAGGGGDAAAPSVGTVGAWRTGDGVSCPAAFALLSNKPPILLIFYRSYLMADDLDPFVALQAALEARGFDVIALFAPSLKAVEVRGWMARWARALGPGAIINATAFSARDEDGCTPFDGVDVPVFQVALSTGDRAGWQAGMRGLSPADLAMHVVLPEVDGRVFLGVASFKDADARDPDVQHARAVHRADPARIAAMADRVAGWVKLREAAQERGLALILSTYPGKAHQMAHAVGLDALASAQAVLADMGAACPDLSGALAVERMAWPLADYRVALAALPEALRGALSAAWGAPEDDPAVDDGAFRFAALRVGRTIVALQPERGAAAARDGEYHDLSRCPRHAYVAFYLWLRAQGTDAIVHMGAHGTLEWLPGKAVGLSDDCWPQALTGAMPVIYPFIVNDPGEAAQAKRRIGAVTIGHAPPPLVPSRHGVGLERIEALLDEFSGADGLDPARRGRLQAAIIAEARALGLEAELGLDGGMSAAETLTRIDRFLCDIKESQFGDGLHVFGRGEQGAAERAGLRAALAGRRVVPGPSGSPHRGRSDVLPTGRNLYSVDPRAVPTAAAYAQGVRMADELVRRHMQDQGDYPRAMVVDLWGSATMRTAGEDYAMALHLIGVKPVWDDASGRVTGVEVVPLDRPRVDVTLRVSGLFRDAFPLLGPLFGQAVRSLALLDEATDWNPFVGRLETPRVYGPQPGRYGLAMGDTLETYGDAARRAAGKAWLAASDHALDRGAAVADAEGLRARVAAADGFVHAQDLPETDLLLAADYAAHEGGFAAAQAVTGGKAALYHLDNRDPARVSARTLNEEIARVVRARAAHPGWIAGMLRHGFRGGAEIAATLDHLGAFAHLTGQVPPQLFDLYHDATLGDGDVQAFLARENPGALAAMESRFAALHAAGLWQTRRNSIVAGLGV
ncbi:cobaltochelatase subunit CobN [Sphingobium sp. KCTC 72723]|uniref:cobaltochelatase subunit CobN n=1 Tax=Sphingobium sp. KCTC 72723 TaxID=2733867 RepID=UPI00165D5F60|nr:cobaltochelatase subunit CobN [Sphingobium sp. KCTC 72723]